MRVLFQADADFNGIIVRAIQRREPGIDFRTATAAGLVGLDDPEVLANAADSGRMVVSHDRKSMPGHFAAFILTRSSPGFLIVPQHLPIARAVEDLVLIWTATEAEEWTDRIYALPL